MLAALTLHSVLLASLWLAARTSPARSRFVSGATEALEVEVTWQPAEPVPPSSPHPELELAPSRSAGQSRSAPPGMQRAATPPAESAGDDPVADASEEPSTTPDSGAAAAAHPIDLGVGANAWRGWLDATKSDQPPRASRGAARVARARPASSTFGLQEGLEQHDRELGIGPSGPVISALYRAAHEPIAPQIGTARFLVTVKSSGSVEVAVDSASSELSAWQSVASLAEGALRRSPPRIPKPRSGMRTLIEIKAEEVFPNGTRRTDLFGPRVEATAPRLRSTEAAQSELEKSNPVAAQAGDQNPPKLVPNLELPGVYVAARGKVCGYRLGLSAMGPILQGGCDLSNAGAKAQRLVQTHVESEELF